MQQIIQHISIFSALVPVLFYLFYRSRFESSRWLLYYFMMSLTFELVFLGMKIELIHLDWLEQYVYHAFYNLEFIMLGTYFHKQHIFKNKRKVCLISLFGILVYYSIYIYEGFPIFNAKGCATFAFIIITYCIFGLRKILINEVPVFLERLAFFWVLCGLLLYFSGNFFLYTFFYQIKDLSKELYNSLWSFVHDVLNIINCGLIALSFTKKQEQ